MSIVGLASRVLKPLSAVSQMRDSAIKLSRLMPREVAIRLARTLSREDPASLPIAKGSFQIRKGSTDLYTFRDVFLQDSMRFVGDDEIHPSCIVDCGAHIGCASLFFTLRYPQATIIAVEPDAENFRMLSANVRQFPNVLPVNAAVWNRESRVRIANPGTNPTGLYVSEIAEVDNPGLPGLTIPQIMKKAGIDHIDVLKIDVEGAEQRLFSSPDCHEWLSNVSVLIVELHDRLYPGCARALYRALDRYEYKQEGRGFVVAVTLMQKWAERIGGAATA